MACEICAQSNPKAMLQNISWSQYFTTLGVATIIYYLFIWIVIFKAKLPVLSAVTGLRPVSFHAEDQPDEMITTAQHIIEEIRPLFVSVGNKNELILALQLLMPVRLVQREVKNYNGFDLSDNSMIVELAKKFDVSMQAMSYRIFRLVDAGQI
jgi:hypothetical protein